MPGAGALAYETHGESFMVPTSFEELFTAIENQPGARIVAGGVFGNNQGSPQVASSHFR